MEKLFKLFFLWVVRRYHKWFRTPIIRGDGQRNVRPMVGA